jgi:hypothetical protein
MWKCERKRLKEKKMGRFKYMGKNKIKKGAKMIAK